MESFVAQLYMNQEPKMPDIHSQQRSTWDSESEFVVYTNEG